MASNRREPQRVLVASPVLALLLAVSLVAIIVLLLTRPAQSPGNDHATPIPADATSTLVAVPTANAVSAACQRELAAHVQLTFERGNVRVLRSDIHGGYCGYLYEFDLRSPVDYTVGFTDRNPGVIAVTYAFGESPRNSHVVTVWLKQTQLHFVRQTATCPDGRRVEATPIEFAVFHWDGSDVPDKTKLLPQLFEPEVTTTSWLSDVLPSYPELTSALCASSAIK